MTRLRFTIEIDYDEDLMHGGDADEEARAWFFERVLRGPDLVISDTGDLGDVVGEIRVVGPIERMA